MFVPRGLADRIRYSLEKTYDIKGRASEANAMVMRESQSVRIMDAFFELAWSAGHQMESDF
jgi:hypothetical protein